MTAVTALAVTSALSDLPGQSAVGQVGEYLVGKVPAGPWTLVAQAGWALLLVWAGYRLAVVGWGKVVPRLLRESVGPGRAAVSGLRYVGLLVDYALATAFCKLKLRPIYWFATLVTDLAAAADRFVGWLPRCAVVPHRFPRAVAALAVCATVLSWNSSRCAPGDGPSCVHPIRQWTNGVDREWSRAHPSSSTSEAAVVWADQPGPPGLPSP
ncbi:hypothetical protein [Frankia sp. Cr2]|uniref:hypothetical protein n=1 Tax=Frankia sp. Cr2 TaxID=3073932 RepID=UPI002AD4EEBD|nr:hypothetical protein [Frankia sp. Cr2]